MNNFILFNINEYFEKIQRYKSASANKANQAGLTAQRDQNLSIQNIKKTGAVKVSCEIGRAHV